MVYGMPLSKMSLDKATRYFRLRVLRDLLYCFLRYQGFHSNCFKQMLFSILSLDILILVKQGLSLYKTFHDKNLDYYLES